MRRLPVLLIFIALVGGVMPVGAGQPEPHVILISIDGLRPDTYLHPEQYGLEIPHLQALMARGAYAEGVEGIFPTVTYPSHTTLITGVRSAEHGVLANSYFAPDTPGPAAWYWKSEAIRVPTLWSAAQEAGLTVANFSWPVSDGCPCDWNIPEVWDNSSSAQTDTMRILKAAAVPEGLIEEIGAATEVWTDANYNINTLERDLLLGQALEYFYPKYRPNLMTVHLIEVDHFAHEEGPDGPTAMQAMEYADQAVGMLVEAIEAAGLTDETTIVITGDHGFAEITREVRPNEWLAETGFLTVVDGKIADWQAQLWTTGAAAAVMLADDAPTGTADRIYTDWTARLAAFSEEERPFDLIPRDELDALGAFPGAAFGLALRPGWYVSKRVGDGFIGEADGGTHGYLPSWEAMHTGLILAGPGIDPEGEAGIVSMLDIAPTLAELLGVDLATARGTAMDWALAR